MELRYILIKCPTCSRIWGRTEEYTEQISYEVPSYEVTLYEVASYEVEENSEYRLCPTCRSRKKGLK